jgi:nitroreductase
MANYDEAAARIREALLDYPELKAFVRFATLAANGHNTQPWRFAIRESGVSILPDFSRRTPVVDPDDHHLFVSLGCAVENFLIAAEATGRDCIRSSPGDPGLLQSSDSLSKQRRA